MTPDKTPTDAELIAELEAAGVAFMAFRGGLGGTKDIWTTRGSQDARKIAAGVRAVLAKWGSPAGAKPSDAQVWAAREAWNQQTNEHEAMRAALIAAALTQPTRAQSVPLTDEWIRSRCKESWIFDTVKQWVRMTEVAHGITYKEGGQHAD